MTTEIRPAASYRAFNGRCDGWTPHAETVFLQCLSETGNATRSAANAGMSLSAAYARRRDPRRPGFAVAWEAALLLAKDRLVDNLFERAIDGEHFSTVRDGGETHYHRPNYRLGLGFLKHLEETQPGQEAEWVSHRFDEWLESLACEDDQALRDTIEPYEQDEPWLRAWARKTFPLVEDSAENERPRDEESPPVWHSGGRWLTSFPPPGDFDGETIAGAPGEVRYTRTLSSAEAAIMHRCEEELEAEERKEEADALERAASERDAYFARLLEDPFGEDEGECEEAPIEYKSMEGPERSHIPFLRRDDARLCARQGGAKRARGSAVAAPAANVCTLPRALRAAPLLKERMQPGLPGT